MEAIMIEVALLLAGSIVTLTVIGATGITGLIEIIANP
jgi:hypothetical protein